MLALPMLGEQFGNFLVGFVDTWLAGSISKEATAAVGNGAYMGWFLSLALQLLGVGCAALVARLFGERRVATAERALNQAFAAAMGLGAALTAVVYAAAPQIATALTRTDAARDLCVTYVRVDALGYTLASVTLIGSAVLRAAGDTRTPMAVMAAVNAVNVVVSCGLVYGWFGPRCGVLGIAIGTVVARCVGGGLMIVVLARGMRGMRLRAALLRPDFALIWRMLRIGLPSSAEAMAMWAAHFCFLRIIVLTGAGDAGTVNYAAHMIAIRLEALTYLPAMAWMTAAATLIGQYLGAGAPNRARRAGHVAAAQGCALAACIGLTFVAGAEPIFAWMTRDEAVRAVGSPAFRLMGLVQPLLAMGIVYVGALRGAGDTRAPMLITFFTALCLRLPGAYLGGVVLHGGLIGAWCGMWADNVARCLLVAWRYRSGRWERARV